jgi:excisionase family DNA binding protein
MSEQAGYYTIRQAAALLGIPTEKTHALLRKGKLKARRDEETGRWLLDPDSVHGRLKAPREGLLREGGASEAATSAVSDATQEKEDRLFDLLILTVIGGVTLLAAGYTLLPVILGV